MSPATMTAECNRIADILGGGVTRYVSVHVMSGIGREFAAGVNVCVPSGDRQFCATTWEEAFAKAEAYARELVLRRDGAAIEYASWFEPPALLLAAE